MSKALSEAKAFLYLGNGWEGPETNTAAILLGIGWALIAIADELQRANNETIAQISEELQNQRLNC